MTIFQICVKRNCTTWMLHSQNIREINPANLSFKGPLLLTGLFITALKQHFFQPDTLFDDALKDVIWRPGDVTIGTTDTAIHICGR